MLTSSAPPSPSDAFLSHSRTYHASRRTSTSSSAASPRFTVTPSRRAHHPQSTSAQSPVLAFARSPHSRKRDYDARTHPYVDSATQYSPPGFPPTYRAPPPETTAAASVPYPPVAIAHTERGETSAVAVVTEPQEPDLRVSPRSVELAQNVQPSRRTPREGDEGAQRGQQRARPDEEGAPREQASLAKRPRSLNQNVKIMPLKYETCDVKDLGVLVADMLMELVRLNDERPLQDGQLTRFHSR